MKTPRQILLERHRSAMPRLDAVRQTALASRTRNTDAVPEPRLAPESAGGGGWRAALQVWRWHLAGFGAAWAIIALLNIDISSPAAPAMAKRAVETPRQIVTALLENRRQLLELIEPAATEPPPPPAPFAPPRRSQIVNSNFMA